MWSETVDFNRNIIELIKNFIDTTLWFYPRIRHIQKWIKNTFLHMKNWYDALWDHDDVIKWKQFSRHWPFVCGIHRSPVNSPHKGQWGGALMFSLICTWINGLVNTREAGELRRYFTHCDVIVMIHLEDCFMGWEGAIMGYMRIM